MSMEQIIQAKMARLQELKQYQAYYGSYTPYPIVLEINQLEAELGRLLRAGGTRPTKAIKRQTKPPRPKTNGDRSQAMVDLLATVSFLGLICVLAFILLGSYVYYLNRTQQLALSYPAQGESVQLEIALRPTFTPTLNPNAPLPAEVVDSANSGELPAANSYLPTVVPSTPIATVVPTITPRPNMTPTQVPELFPLEKETAPPPEPTKAAPTPIPARLEQRNTPTPMPAPPTAIPAPSYPFAVTETGNRAFQKTTVQTLVIYVSVVSEGNIPLGGYKIIGDQVPSGQHIESALSTWNWSVVNCLDCSYMKQGNLKFEPGPIADGVWNIYLADENGQPVSPVHTFSYSSAPDQWVWDFILFRRLHG